MPLQLSPDRLCVTEGNRVVSITPVEESECVPAQYTVLEEFVKSISQGNIHIFRRIMQASMLSEHSMFHLFQKDIYEVLIDKKRSFLDRDVDVRLAHNNTLFYSQFIHDQFDCYRSTIEEIHWQELKQAVIDCTMKGIYHYKMAATCWGEALGLFVKESMKERLVQSTHLQVAPTPTIVLPSWLHFNRNFHN